MSTFTLTPAAGDFDRWEDEFRTAPAPVYDPGDMPELDSPAVPHRPARTNARRAAIDESLREYR